MNNGEYSVHNELGSFVIRIQHRQNSSWQGQITWIDQNRTVNFRSAWEMMKLIDEALEMTAPQPDRKVPSWKDDD